MLMAGLDSVPGGLAGDLTPPCVPEDLGNMRFYDAMPAKTWLVNATSYGHGDVINDPTTRQVCKKRHTTFRT